MKKVTLKELTNAIDTIERFGEENDLFNSLDKSRLKLLKKLCTVVDNLENDADTE